MRKLLSADFSRLWKSKTFWLLEFFCFAFGTFSYTLVAINTHNLGQGWLEYNAHAYFYLPVMYLPAVIAVFSCFFVGADYSDGTIRNKLIVGHSISSIYLSFLLTASMAMLFFAAAYLFAVIIIGLPFSGSAVITNVELNWRVFNLLLIFIEYVCLFVLLSMLDSNKARNVVVSLLVVFSIILIGMMVYSRYSQPEFVNHVVELPDGSLELKKGEPNSKYLSGPIRTFFEWVTLIIPHSSALLSLDKTFGFDWRNPVIAVIMIAVLIIIGIQLLKKRDIK